MALAPGIYFRRGTIDDKRADGQVHIKAGFVIVTPFGAVEVQQVFTGADILAAVMALLQWVGYTAIAKAVPVSPVISSDVTGQLATLVGGMTGPGPMPVPDDL